MLQLLLHICHLGENCDLYFHHSITIKQWQCKQRSECPMWTQAAKRVFTSLSMLVPAAVVGLESGLYGRKRPGNPESLVERRERRPNLGCPQPWNTWGTKTGWLYNYYNFKALIQVSRSSMYLAWIYRNSNVFSLFWQVQFAQMQCEID